MYRSNIHVLALLLLCLVASVTRAGVFTEWRDKIEAEKERENEGAPAVLRYRSADDADGATQTAAVEALLSRWLPLRTDEFLFAIMEHADDEDDSLDVFEISTPSRDVSIVSIRGTSGTALAAGLNWFWKHYCHCQVTWFSEQLDVPSPLPVLDQTVRIVSPFSLRYYYNVVAYGYSNPWWTWERWEREIDWMALNGINLPLAFKGQEYVWKQLYEEFGLSADELDEFFTGPGFLPWQRMGNVYDWAGPLPHHYVNETMSLQIQILNRMRSFGMTPVLPAFAGHVPRGLNKLYATSNITQLAPWEWGSFNGTFFLAPTDPLFKQLGERFIEIQTEVYGSDHFYNCDVYNEVKPPSFEPAYLANSSRSVIDGMLAADESAVWVMQGWFLHINPTWWTPERTAALLDAVPLENLLMLDLYAEVFPIWSETESFYGRNFIWCVLEDFGGRDGLHGALPSMNTGLMDALHNSSFSVGAGITPEAIERNPIVYDFMTDMFWRDTAVDLDVWVAGFVTRRYSQLKTPDEAFTAWAILQDTVYSCNTTNSGAAGSMVAARPDFSIPLVGCCSHTHIWYAPTDLLTAWEFLLDASNVYEPLANSTFYKYDVVDVTTQVLTNLFLAEHRLMNESYWSGNVTAFELYSTEMLSIIEDMDELLYTHPKKLVGSWISDAESWAVDASEEKLYSFNARNQITLWGESTSPLHDYAYHLWAGLVGEFYLPRWELFFASLSDTLLTGYPFNHDLFTAQVTELEWEWGQSFGSYPTTTVGDSVEVARDIQSKYRPVLERVYGSKWMVTSSSLVDDGTDDIETRRAKLN